MTSFWAAAGSPAADTIRGLDSRARGFVPYLRFTLCGLASRVVCKSWERVTGPLFVHTIKDTIEDTFTTAAGGKGAQGADAAAHFDEESFNDVGRAQPFPVGLGAIQEGQ